MESDTIKSNGTDIPISELKKQDGIKKDIVRLVRKAPFPHKECQCQTVDFLMALQHVLDKHGVKN